MSSEMEIVFGLFVDFFLNKIFINFFLFFSIFIYKFSQKNYFLHKIEKFIKC